MLNEINLTQTELDMIKNKRMQQFERDHQAALNMHQEIIRQDKAAREYKKRVDLMESALLEADTSGIFVRNDDGHLVFKVGTNVDCVVIEEHVVYGPSTYARGKNKGMKYQLCGAATGYKTTWYTKAATLIRRIEQAQSDLLAKQARIDTQKNLDAQALSILTDKYPHCVVTAERAVSKHYSTPRSVIKVNNSKGWYRFTYRMSSDEIIFDEFSHHIAPCISQQVKNLILS